VSPSHTPHTLLKQGARRLLLLLLPLATLAALTAFANAQSVVYRELFPLGTYGGTQPGRQNALAEGWRGYFDGMSNDVGGPVGATRLQIFGSGAPSQGPAVNSFPVNSGEGNAFWSPQENRILLFTREFSLPAADLSAVQYQTRPNTANCQSGFGTPTNCTQRLPQDSHAAISVNGVWYVSEVAHRHLSGQGQTDTPNTSTNSVWEQANFDVRSVTWMILNINTDSVPPTASSTPVATGLAFPTTGTIDGFGIWIPSTQERFNQRFDNYTLLADVSANRPSDQKAGSVLVFPYYTSASDGSFSKSDTLIQISNVCNGAATSAGVPNYSFLHLFFMNGSNCSPADTFVCLTPNGSIQIKASDYDPTLTGYLIAVAVDAQGRPTQNNCFIGSAFVRDDTNGVIDSYGAEAFWKYTPGSISAAVGSSAAINLNGVDYDGAPVQFSAQVQDPALADEFVVLASVNGDLGTALSSTTQTGVGVLYRADEAPASFQPQIGAGCFSVTAVDKTKIRIVPGNLDTFLKDSYGYLKFNVSSPAVGLLISKQGPANQAGNRWSGIRTLHKTAVGAATLSAPCFPPFCGF
jgi:hypothetical protein